MKKITIDINKEEFTKYVIFAALGAVAAAALALFISFLIKAMNFANPRILYFLIPLFLLLAAAGAFKKYYSPSLKYSTCAGRCVMCAILYVYLLQVFFYFFVQF